jgi:hypothetical protein
MSTSISHSAKELQDYFINVVEEKIFDVDELEKMLLESPAINFFSGHQIKRLKTFLKDLRDNKDIMADFNIRVFIRNILLEKTRRQWQIEVNREAKVRK